MLLNLAFLQEATVAPLPWYATVLLSFIATIPLLLNAWIQMKKLDKVLLSSTESQKMIEGTTQSITALQAHVAIVALAAARLPAPTSGR